MIFVQTMLRGMKQFQWDLIYLYLPKILKKPQVLGTKL